MRRVGRIILGVVLSVVPLLAHAHADLQIQIDEATRRIDAAPRDARGWLHRAELYRIHEDWAAAERDYAQAARLDPKLDVVDLCRGRMLTEMGTPARALPYLDRFVKAHPRHVEALAARARARRADGDPWGAVADWNAALMAANEEDARPAYYLERADAMLAADPRAIPLAVEGLIQGLTRLHGAAALRARIRELDPERRLPPVPPQRELTPPAPVAPTAPLASLTRGPYLQVGTPTSIVVRWRTDSSTDGVVKYGASPASLTSTATQPTLTTDHVVSIAGLTPNTRYYYSVGSSTQTLAGGTADYFFTTSPAPGTTKPFRVWVLGDSGTANASATAVRNAYTTFTGTRITDLWLMLGDNAYPDGTDAQYQAAVFSMYPAMLRKSVLWPTFGNHDGHSADSASETGPYYDIFTLPRAGEAGGEPSGTEAYYSFDYGNVHFVCLDSYDLDRTPAGDMLTWLEEDLSANTKDWIVAFWHHPPYSKGSHDSDLEGELIDMRVNANPILEAHGVDLALSGHSHDYERSFLIDGHYGLSGTFSAANKKDGGNGRPSGTGPYQKPLTGPDPHKGTVYTVAGASGQASGGALNHPAMFLSLNVLGSMVLDFNGNRLDATYLDSAGVVRDTFTIIKQPSLLPVTDFEGTPLVGPAPLTVQFTDKTLNGPTAWSWDLDGNATQDSTVQNPSRNYASPGCYTVSLTATNVAGVKQTTKTGYVCATAAAPPVAVTGVTIGKPAISWGSTALASFYDVVRGSLGTLRSSGGNFTAATTGCVEDQSLDASSSDASSPTPGSGFWYLVRAADCANRGGSYDDGTQVASRDAGIAAAAPTCP
ncbi:MAG TPA: metallophosphoesterase [Candidatus Polarisedimenticolaceae bacterium]|nr:metallophosphoesterase [Candidatus Polarisedimenticolaceae bacterium]